MVSVIFIFIFCCYSYSTYPGLARGFFATCPLCHPLGLLLSYDTTIPAQGAKGLQPRWPSLRRGQPRPSPFFAFPMGPALTVALQTLAP